MGDLQLLLSDQRSVFRRFRAGDRELGGDLQTLRALDSERLFQRGNVIRISVAVGIHATQ
ncbi:hypothetical protein ABH999_000703 [Bradyrhizobium yuanmingense]